METVDGTSERAGASSSGREVKRRSGQEREQLLREFEASGMTQREFATKYDIGYSTFTDWLRKRRSGTRKAGGRQRWIEVSQPVPTPSPRSAYCLEAPWGWTLRMDRGFDSNEVAILIELSRASCSR